MKVWASWCVPGVQETMCLQARVQKHSSGNQMCKTSTSRFCSPYTKMPPCLHYPGLRLLSPVHSLSKFVLVLLSITQCYCFGLGLDCCCAVSRAACDAACCA